MQKLSKAEAWFYANQEMLNSHHCVYDMKLGWVARPTKKAPAKVIVKSVKQWTSIRNTPMGSP